MDKIKAMAAYLKILDDIVEANKIAVKNLEQSLEIAAALISTILDYESSKEFTSLDSYIGDDNDSTEELADKIVEEIKRNSDKPGIHALNVMINEDVDTEKLMEIVREKLKEEKDEKTSEDVLKGDSDTDEFDFREFIE